MQSEARPGLGSAVTVGRMRAVAALRVATAGLLVAALLGAAPANATTTAHENFHMLVLGEFDKLGDALNLAESASTRLKLPLDWKDRESPRQLPRAVGRVVSIHQPGADRFVVTAGLDDREIAPVSMSRLKAAFPNAHFEKIRLDPDALDYLAFEALAVRNIVILGSFLRFEVAEKRAMAIAKKCGFPYDALGRIFDPARGFVLPNDSNDEMYRGHCFARRDDTEMDGKPFLSVERSDAYAGLKPDYYIIVGGIVGDDAVAGRLAALRPFVPDLYAPRTTIYFGCMH